MKDSRFFAIPGYTALIVANAGKPILILLACTTSNLCRMISTRFRFAVVVKGNNIMFFTGNAEFVNPLPRFY